MKYKKLSLVAGLSTFLCFCLLTAVGVLAARIGENALIIALAEGLAFLLPCIPLVKMQTDRDVLKKRLRFRKMAKGMAGLSVTLGVCTAIISMFFNLLLHRVIGVPGVDLTVTALGFSQYGMTAIGRILSIVVLSAAVEEIFLRGLVLPLHEQVSGTGPCLVVSGLIFALLHADLMFFAGPLLAGIAYAYLTFAAGNITPAIIAHMAYNLYFVLAAWAVDTYAPFGIWQYFAGVNVILLLLFLYLFLRQLEKLLTQGRIPHFQKTAGLYDIYLLICNPGFLALLAAFVARAFLGLI